MTIYLCPTCKTELEYDFITIEYVCRSCGFRMTENELDEYKEEN